MSKAKVDTKSTLKSKQFIDDMIRCRGMGFVWLGMKVEVSGEIGTINGMNSGSNLDVRFANELEFGKGVQNCYPQWDIRYFDEDNKVIADYRQIM